jgi:hypothetical protein
VHGHAQPRFAFVSPDLPAGCCGNMEMGG